MACMVNSMANASESHSASLTGRSRSKRVKFWKARKKAAGIGKRPAGKGQNPERGKVAQSGKREDGKGKGGRRSIDDAGIRNHAPCETRT